MQNTYEKLAVFIPLLEEKGLASAAEAVRAGCEELQQYRARQEVFDFAAKEVDRLNSHVRVLEWRIMCQRNALSRLEAARVSGQEAQRSKE